MSSIYIQEPPTNGKILLNTTVGEIEIELWSRESPKACRNFIQLCLEGYYDKTFFHRVVKDFIVQGGDPTDTGHGGESACGFPFKDEFHSRLRFVRRGLLAMANDGKDSNRSQFFFTLAPTPELQNVNTIFGKVVGNTVFNMLRLVEAGEIDPETGRPSRPHQIINSQVLSNPFQDIQPRQLIAPLEAQDLVDLTRSKLERASKSRATKDFKLLSFGDEAEADAEDLVTAHESLTFRGKSAHDMLHDDPLLSCEVGVGKKKTTQMAVKIENLECDSNSGDSGDNSDKGSKQLEKKRDRIKAEIAALKREMKQSSKSTKSTTYTKSELISRQKRAEAEDANHLLKAFHDEQKRYDKRVKTDSSRESATMEILKKFKKKLSSVSNEEESWMKHSLCFDDNASSSHNPIIAKDANTKGDDWFDIYDPRNPINKRRRQNK